MLALAAQAHGSASDNYRLGQADNILYQLAQSKYFPVFHDETSGNNSVSCALGSPDCGSNLFLTGYDAGTGYDLASGLGSVNVAEMVSNWNSFSLASTSTSLKLNGSNSAYTGVHGQSLTFNVSVSPTTATGVAGIVDNANEISGGIQNNGQLAIPIVAGSGSATYNGLPGGSYTVWARYGGDTADASSTSTPPINVTIAPEASTTSLSVNAYDPSTGKAISTVNIPYGSYVFADAGITGTAEGSKTQGVATGTVTFLNGGAAIGTGTVSSSNEASWPTLTSAPAVMPGGSYNLTARYSGDASYESSTSSSVLFNVVPQATTVTPYMDGYILAAADSTQIQIYLSAAPNLGVPPTGSINFTANGVTLATTGVYTGGEFWGYFDTTIKASLLLPGPNSVTATYSGDSNYASSSTSFSIDNIGSGAITVSPIPNVNVSPGGTVYAPLTFTPASGFAVALETLCAVDNPTDNSVTCLAQADYYLGGAGPESGMMTLTAPSSASAGVYQATLRVLDWSSSEVLASSPFTITVAAAPVASLAIFSNGNLNIGPGATNGNSSSVTIIPSGGFIGQVNLSCAVTTVMASPVAPPTCSVPPSVTLANKQAMIVPVSVATSATTTVGNYTFGITATAASTPSVTGSSTAELTVSSSPTFALAGSGSASYTRGATTGNTTTVTATAFNGYRGTVYLVCTSVPLTAVSGPVSTYPECDVPNSITVGGTAPTSFTLTVSATGNPAYPVAGVYLLTLTGYDSASADITSQTAIELTVGAPYAALFFSNSGSIAVNPGATTGNSSTITILPVGGFTGTVNLRCVVGTSMSGNSDLPTCTIPGSVVISGTSAATAALTVSTTAATSSALVPHSRYLRFGGLTTVLAVVFFFGLPSKRRRWMRVVGAIVLAVSIGALGCGGGGGGGSGGGGGGGGGGNPGTTPGAYTVLVIGADAATGNITAQTTVTLTVN
jgi:hypothetical protein